MFYATNRQQYINLAQVVHAEFTPARHVEYDDEEENDGNGNPRHVSRDEEAAMVVTMSSVEMEVDYAYEDQANGVAATSQIIRLKGQDAERMNAVLQEYTEG
jgi:hypothetical protein